MKATIRAMEGSKHKQDFNITIKIGETVIFRRYLKKFRGAKAFYSLGRLIKGKKQEHVEELDIFGYTASIENHNVQQVLTLLVNHLIDTK